MGEKVPTGYNFIKNEIRTLLSSVGFKSYKASTLYRTTENDLLQFIYFQKGVNSLSNQMTISIVQQGLFTSGCSFDVLQPGSRIGQFTNVGKDKWWFCDNIDTANEGAAEIKEILFKDVLPFFDFSNATENIPELISSDKYSFVWCNPTTFVDKGYFFLKATLYNEAIEWWEKHQWSKVPKFRTIKKLIDEHHYKKVDDILKENSRLARAKLKI